MELRDTAGNVAVAAFLAASLLATIALPGTLALARRSLPLDQRQQLLPSFIVPMAATFAGLLTVGLLVTSTLVTVGIDPLSAGLASSRVLTGILTFAVPTVVAISMLPV